MDRRGWLLAVVLGASLVGPVLAGPSGPCLKETLDVYLVEGSCAIGDVIFKDFSYSHTGFPILESQILVGPFVSPQGPHLLFSSTAFSVVAGQQAVLDLIYNIDPPPIIIRGFEEEMFAETPHPPGSVTIDTWLCVGGFFPDCTGGGEVSLPQLLLQLAHYGTDNPDNKLTDSIMFDPTSILGVWHTITLDGGPVGAGGSASFTSLGNQAYTVPEPATWLLLGCGLLSLAFLRRRRAG
jgi:hypothetical protein